MKKLRQRLTLNEVNQAINSLKEQNLNLTADNILAEVIRQSNGTVGGSKGTVLKFKRQLESIDNSTNLRIVSNTSTVQYSINRRTYGTESVPDSIDKTLISTLEVQLWERLEVRLDDKLRQHSKVHQVEEMLQEMHELWLRAVNQYVAAKANLESLEPEVQRLSESEAQAIELHQVNEHLVLENNELKSKLEAIQHERQTQNEEATNQAIQFQSTLNQAADQIEIQQTQLNQLNQDLNSLHELWLEAVFQIQITSSSAATSVITESDPLESYFQALAQLHQLTPVQKYDCAMKLFGQGLGPSEISRILEVNKGTLQHYKEGRRKRPNNG